MNRNVSFIYDYNYSVPHFFIENNIDTFFNGNPKSFISENFNGLTCPKNILTNTDPNSCASLISNGLSIDEHRGVIKTLSWQMKGATTDASPSLGLNQLSSYVFNKGVTEISYRGLDVNDNPILCFFVVTVVDNQSPVLLSSPGNITVNNTSGTCSSPVRWIEPVVLDNCISSNQLLINVSHQSGQEFPIGSTAIEYIISDGVNVKSHQFEIIVNDVEPPELFAPPTLICDCGERIPDAYTSREQFQEAGGNALDNCSIDYGSFRYTEQKSSGIYCPYKVTRTYSISDTYGNVSEIKHRIEVVGEEIAFEGKMDNKQEELEVKLKSGAETQTVSISLVGISNVTCSGGSDGSINLDTTSTNGPITSIVWDHGPTTLDISNLSAGDYSVTVTDGDGSNSRNFTIDDPNPLVAPIASSDQTICYNSVPQNITATKATGGTSPYSYQWQSSPNGSTDWNNIAGATGLTLTGAQMGNLTSAAYFRIIVDDKFCPVVYSNNVAISVDPESVGGTIAGATTVCSGTNSTLLTLSGHVGTVQKWESSVDGGLTWTTIANTGLTYTASNLAQTTTYRAEVKSGICSEATSAEVIVSVDPESVGGTIAGATTVCLGLNSTLLTLSGHIGTVQKWESSVDGGLTWTAIANTGLTYTASNLIQTTTYRAEVKSGICSEATSAEVIVSVDLESVGGTIAGATTVCLGSNSTLLTLSGHIGTVQKWESSVDGGLTWTAIANTGLTYTASNLTQTTTYRSAVKSGICSEATSAEVIVSVDPESVGGTISGGTTVCTGLNSTTLTLTGYTGTIQTWDYSTDGGVSWNPISNTNSTYTATNLTQTTSYRVVVKSGVCGESESTIAEVTVLVDHTIALTSDASTENQTICFNTSVIPITYLVGEGGNGAQVEDLPAGLSGFYLNGSFTISGTPTATGTFNYAVITTGNSCMPDTANGTMVIGEELTHSASITIPVDCNLGAATVEISATGGFTPYQFSFNGETNQTGVFTNVYAGINLQYQVDDLNGCGPVNGTITVDDMLVLSATLTPIQMLCNGGTASGEIEVSLPTGGSGTYQVSIDGITWFDVSTASPHPFTGLSTGNYFVQIRDKATPTCIITLPAITIDEPPVLVGGTTATEILCFNGTSDVQMSASGGTPPYRYEFVGTLDVDGDGLITGVSGSVLPGRIYSWKVLDANDCEYLGTITIIEPEDITNISLTADKSTICEGENINLHVSADGGTPNLSYNWSGPDGYLVTNTSDPILPTVDTDAEGFYVATVVDGKDCSKKDSVYVTVLPTPTVNVPVVADLCNGDGGSAITFTGSADHYNWVIDIDTIGIAANGTDVIPLFTATNGGNEPVTATVTVTPVLDEGCSGVAQTFTITVNPTPNVIIVPETSVFCNESRVRIDLASNVDGTSFAWTREVVDGSISGGFTNGATTTQISQNLNAGNQGADIIYIITPTSPDGCEGKSDTAIVEFTTFDLDENLGISGPSNNTPFCPGEEVRYRLRSENGNWYRIRFHYEIDNPNVGLLPASDGPFGYTADRNTRVEDYVTFDAVNTTGVAQTATIVFTATAYRRNNDNFLCNVNTKTRTIIVNPFAIECPADYTANNITGSCDASIVIEDPNIVTCPPADDIDWVMTGATNDFENGVGEDYVGTYLFNVGTTTVDYSAEDAFGNLASCTFDVVVNDDENPTINCPTGDTTIYAESDKCSAIFLYNIEYLDNCVLADSFQTEGLAIGSEFPVGNTALSFYAVDSSGNSITCSFDVIVTDTISPTITCIGDTTVCAEPGLDYTNIGIGWDAAFSDNCPNATIEYFLGSVSGTSLGNTLNNVSFSLAGSPHTVVARVADAGGRTSTCSFTVTVNEKPEITRAPTNESVCLNGSVVFTAAVNGTPAPTFKWRKDGLTIDDGSNYSGTETDSLTISGLTTGHTGSYDVVVTNDCGSATSTPATLTVSSAPVITLQPASQVNCLGEDVDFTVAVIGGVITTDYFYQWEKWDNTAGDWVVTGASSTLTVASIATADNGAQFRVRIEDDCFNKDTSGVATLTVNQMDNSLALVTESLCEGESTSFTAYSIGSTPDSYEWQKDGLVMLGEVGQTLTLTNVALNDSAIYSASAIFTINGGLTCQTNTVNVGRVIMDDGPDIVATPETQLICSGSAITPIVLTNSEDPGNSGTSYNWSRSNIPELSGSIALSGTSGTISGDFTSNNSSVIYTVEFYVTAVANGCESKDTIYVSVGDTTAPILSVTNPCPGNYNGNIDLDSCGARITYTEPLFDDNCDGNGLSRTNFMGIASGELFPVGVTTVTYEYTDAAGNGPATCAFDVSVTDNQPPLANCNPNVTIELDASGIATIRVNDIDNVSSDNCGIDSMWIDADTFDCTELGDTTLTLTVRDNSGLISTCTSLITVEDNIPFSVSCKDTTIQLDATGNASIVASDVDDSSTDNCGIASMSVAPNSFDCTTVGPNTVVLTVTNNNGVTETCNATVTVEDSIRPTAVCRDTTVQLDAGGNASITAAEIENGSSDICGISGMAISLDNFDCSNVGSNAVTLTVTDANGNFSTCNSTITIADTVAPVAVCKDSIIQLNAAGNATISAIDIDNGSSDNCGTPTLIIDNNSFDCTNIGPNIVTLVATDGYGNTDTCTATVTVADDTYPVDITVDSISQTAIDCYGDTATVTIHAKGGVGTLTYTLGTEPSQTDSVFTGIFAGTYNWSVTDLLHCGDTISIDSFKVTEVDELSATIAASDVSCSSTQDDGKITISNSVGGSGSYEYSKDGGANWQSDSTFTDLTPGFYDIWIRDANVIICELELQANVEVYIITADIASSDVTCYGGNDGSISITDMAGGTPPYQYSIDGSSWSSSNILSGLQADTFEVRIQDSDGCIVVLDSTVILTQPDSLMALIDSTNVTCSGADDGIISLSLITGGSGKYEFQLNGFRSWQSDSVFSNLPSGTYVVEIRDSIVPACEITLNGALQISELPPLWASVDSTNVTCNATDDGTITILNETGGSGTYEYTIDGGINWQDSANFVSLPVGTYDVQMRDSNAVSCIYEIDLALTLTQPPVLNIDTDPINVSQCIGATVNFSVTNAGGAGTISYTWQKESSGSWTDIANGGTIAGATDSILLITGIVSADTGRYRVILEDACLKDTSNAATLTVNEILNLSGNSYTEICENEDYTFQVNTSGATPDYQWQIFDLGPVPWLNLAGEDSSSLVITGATINQSGHYRVELTYDSCHMQSEIRELLVNPSPKVDSFVFPQYCAGDSTALIILSGATAYDISGGAAVGLFLTPADSLEIPRFRAAAGTDVITIIPRANGCIGTPYEFTITIEPTPSIIYNLPSPNVCSDGTAVINLSSSADSALFTWTVISYDPGISGFSNATDSLTTNITQTLTNSGLTNGTVTYEVSAKKGNCKGASIQVTVTVVPTFTLEVIDSLLVCSPETVNLEDPLITVGSTAGLYYEYYVGHPDSSGSTQYTNPTAVNTSETYFIKATDLATFCYKVDSIVVTVAPSPTIVVVVDPTPVCFGDSVDITGVIDITLTTAGLTFTYWEDDIATIALTGPDKVKTDGIYYIKGETAEGCYNIQAVTVTIYVGLGDPVFDLGNGSVACFGDNSRIYLASAVNELSMVYSIDAASETAGNSINPSTGEISFASGYTGTIDVTATAYGCGGPNSSTHTITIYPPVDVNFTATPDIICEGEEVFLTANIPGSASQETFDGSNSGNYTINRNSTINSPITPSPVSGGGKITANDIVIVTLYINHTWNEDLDIYLVSPSGEILELSTDNGGSNDNYRNTTFSTNSTNPINWPFDNEEFEPEGSINDLIGADIDGEWKLRVVNDTDRRIGELLDWDIEIIHETNTGNLITIFNGSGTSGDSIVNTGIARDTIYPEDGTHTYTATIIDENGCVVTSNEVTVVVQQSPDVVIEADYCVVPEMIQLNAVGGEPGAYYEWTTGDEGIDVNVILVDEVNLYGVTVTNPGGICSRTVYLPVSNELVTNGGFTNTNTGSGGPTDFTYGYRWTVDNPALDNELVDDSGNRGFGVGTRGRDYHGNFWGIDHTENSIGPRNFMLVNGHGEEYTIWEQQVVVTPNTNYYFAAWAMSLNAVPPYARLRFEVNGVPVGTIAELEAGPNSDAEVIANDHWVRFYSDPLWNSGSTSGMISIRIINLETAYNGNDFALDDISFGTLDPLPLTMNLRDTFFCEGGTVRAESNSENGLNPTYNWTHLESGTVYDTDTMPYLELVDIAEPHEGNYELRVTDEYGCDVLPDTFFIEIFDAAEVDAGSDMVVCSVDSTISLGGWYGGSADSAIWSGAGSFTDTTIYDLVGGTFSSVQYRFSNAEINNGEATLVLKAYPDNSVCDPVYDTLIVTIYESPVIDSIVTTNPLCNSVLNGTSLPYVSGGKGPYTWLWSNGETSRLLTGLGADTLYLQVTDDNGCTVIDSVIISEPDSFIISVRSPVITLPSCYGSDNGMAIVEVEGGIPPYTFNWDANADPGDIFADTAFFLTAGSYNVFVTDSANCAAANIPVNISDPAPPTLFCPGDYIDSISPDRCWLQLDTLVDPISNGYCDYSIYYELRGDTVAADSGLLTYFEFPIGQTFVKYLIVDEAGNNSSCEFMVWIKHVDIPTANYNCPNPDLVEAYADTTSCIAGIRLNPLVITDPCNEIDSVWHNSPADGATAVDPSGGFPVGVTTFNWYITDKSGNIDSCEVTVYVIDTTTPVFIECPVDVIDSLTNNDCVLDSDSVGVPTLGGDCSPLSLTYELLLPNGTTLNDSGLTTGYSFPVGLTQVYYTLADTFGNEAICNFTVLIKVALEEGQNLTYPENYKEVDAARDSCEAYVSLSPLIVTDTCDAIDTVWHDSDYASDSMNTSGFYPIDATEFNWYIRGRDGDIIVYPVTVVVNDYMPELSCPSDTIIPADRNDTTATGITLLSPEFHDNCPDSILTWISWGATELTYGDTASNGINILNGPETFNVGVTWIEYTFTDQHGHDTVCAYTVTVVAAPEIECPPDTMQYANDTCVFPYDPGVPELIHGATPVNWYWTMFDEAGAIVDADSTIGVTPFPAPPNNDIGVYDFPLGVTAIQWIATNVSGADTCSHWIEVIDTTPPVIYEFDLLKGCMEPVYMAHYNPAEFDKYSPDRPDYFLFIAGDVTLDLTILGNYNDNCELNCPDSITWQIDFTDVRDQDPPHGLNSKVSIIGSGQISEYPYNIEFPGDGTYMGNIDHWVSYFATDCSGNTSLVGRKRVTVTPRPKIVKTLIE